MKRLTVILCAAAFLAACHMPSPPTPPDPNEELIAKGREIFFNETFGGNGRTCGSCHPAENNFAIDPSFIATLPDDDPLFVAEFIPALKANFENPRLMREFGLITENLDGFDDLANKFTLRGVPHTLGLRFTIDSSLGPLTGWSGDGSPGDGSLRSFAVGAVIQHFTKTLNRVAGVDFRLPTDEELDALEAFQFSLGRQQELTLPLPLKGTVAKRGQEIFNDLTLGKCSACHFNAGANFNPNLPFPTSGNLNFNTGVENLPDQPQNLTGELIPPDDGFGTPGDGTFNTPSLVEAADTGPFFHNNSIETIEGSVAFYNGDAFNNSPAGQLIKQATGSGINIDGTQVVEVAAFLRVINALENIRQSIELLEKFAAKNFQTVEEGKELLDLALAETKDSSMVLKSGGLHPAAVKFLRESKKLIKKARRSLFFRGRYATDAIEKQKSARDELVESS
jgi:mono/diheme cytochrome c family protein